MTDQKSSLNTPGQSETLQTVLDAIPSPIFLIDNMAQVELANRCAKSRRGVLDAYTHRERMGNILGCINALSCSDGCGGTRNCEDCPIRKAVADAIDGNSIFRDRVLFQLLVDGKYVPIHMWLTASLLKYDGRNFVALILEDVAEFIETTALIPVCKSCGKAGEGVEPKKSIEAFINERFASDCKHGLCAECAKQATDRKSKGA
ncbi:MAG: hypothetical protein QGG42_12760 [Phycisphaerae bacterium]|jgi:hypothetical protein|nr:hypothetical protein [Phycisphaerae bacterium]